MKNILIVVGLAALAAFSNAQGQPDPLRPVEQERSIQNRSVVDLLSFSGNQLVQLDQLWDFVSAKREDHEKRLAKKKPEPSQKDLENADKEIRKAFDTAKLEAKRLLQAGQVYLLEQRADEIRVAPDSKYKALYTMEFAEFMSKPTDIESARRWREARDTFGKQSASANYSNSFRRSGFGIGFGFGFGHHGHNGHIHHHHRGRGR